MRTLLAALLVLLTWPAQCQSSDDTTESGLTIRTYFEPEGEIYVGQMVRLWVEVTTPTWFTTAPRFPELRLDGAIALMPEQLGVNFSERKGGVTVTGQRQRYVIIPQRAGQLFIPPLQVTLAVAADGKPAPPATLVTKPAQTTIVLPPGAENLDNIVSVEDLAVSEKYDRAPDGLRVGDAITRTVTLKAENTFALALPETRFATIEGLRLYAAQPRLEDKVNRGRYSASRVDAATYVLEREGTFELPEITVKWWNPATQTMEQSVLSSLELAIAANPDYIDATDSADKVDDAKAGMKRWLSFALDWLKENIAWLTIAAMGLYAVHLAWQRFGAQLIGRWHAYRERRLNSESHAFAEFRKACRSGDQRRIVNRFWLWLDHFTPRGQVPTLARHAGRPDNSEFIGFVDKLAKARYRPPAAKWPDGTEIKRHAAKFRTNLKIRGRKTSDGNLLNPGATGTTTGAVDV